MMGWNDYEPVWMLIPAVFILAMAACVIVMFFMMRGRRGGSSRDRTQQILKERFARGEIDKAEYDDRRRALRS